MSQLTGRKSQAGFEFPQVDEKTRLLKRAYTRTEVVAVPAHGASQAQTSSHGVSQGMRAKSTAIADALIAQR